MKRGVRYLRYYVMILACLLVADSALAFGGPFTFSFATGFLNRVFLAPFALVGCAG